MKEYGLMKETESKTESHLLIDIFKKSKVVVKNKKGTKNKGE